MSARRMAWLLGLLLAAYAAEVRGDRPGFYPGDIPGNGPSRMDSQHRGQHGPTRGGSNWSRPRSSVNMFFGIGPGYYLPPLWANPYPYSNWANWGYGWGGPGGIYYDPATNRTEYYLPPTHAPAELNYGPLAVDRFLGIRRDPFLVPAPAASDLPARDVTPDDIADQLRKSNDESRARARRFLDFGNALFLEQRFHEALQRYKSAIEAAPDLPEAYLREGFALIAVNQYRLAAKSLRIALELDPDYVKFEFRLDALYGDNRLAKTSHLELLARQSLENPTDADLLFLVGLSLYADGEIDRAHRFLTKAADLGGEEAARLLAPLLGKAPPPEAVPAGREEERALDT
ncbi:MAG: hypothetical protein ACYC0X_05795 [Pirellulaceae bacterium]